MSYRDMIDISLNVDTSELQDTLGRIDQNIEVLTDRVKSIEDGGYPVDEDKVHDIIATYQSDEGLITEHDVDSKLRDYVSSDDLDSLIGDYLSSNDYPSNDDVDMKISDAIENGDFVNPAQMEEAITEKLDSALDASQRFEDLATKIDDVDSAVDVRLDGITERLDALENDELGNTVGTLANTVDSLTKRMDLLPDVNALEERVENMQAQIDTLVLDLARQNERNDTAMTFFDLIKQAFALLQRGS